MTPVTRLLGDCATIVSCEAELACLCLETRLKSMSRGWWSRQSPLLIENTEPKSKDRIPQAPHSNRLDNSQYNVDRHRYKHSFFGRESMLVSKWPNGLLSGRPAKSAIRTPRRLSRLLQKLAILVRLLPFVDKDTG